jgi:hypothetical protein
LSQAMVRVPETSHPPKARLSAGIFQHTKTSSIPVSSLF